MDCNHCVRCCRAPDFGDHGYCNACICTKENARFTSTDDYYATEQQEGEASGPKDSEEKDAKSSRKEKRRSDKSTESKKEKRSKDKGTKQK